MEINFNKIKTIKAKGNRKMIDAVKKRRSIRSFEERDVEEEKIREILTSAMYSPSSKAIYPWEIIVVRDEEKRKAISETRRWSYFASDAPVCFVILGDDEESDLWIEDSSILSEHILLEAVEQGLGGCWIQIRNRKTKDGKDAEQYIRNILKIPRELRVLSVLAIGYPGEEKSPHDESEFRDEKVHFEKY